jgi:hypothetical protein
MLPPRVDWPPETQTRVRCCLLRGRTPSGQRLRRLGTRALSRVSAGIAREME